MKEKKYFFVFVHGNNGDGSHMEGLLKNIQEIYKEEAIYLNSSANTPTTHLGVEEGGKRLCKEIIETLKENKVNYKIKFSMVSHSLGGLYTRNCLKWLDEEKEQYLVPISYISISSPHLGARSPGLKGKIGDFYMTYGLKQTGKDLSLQSDILLRMSKEKEYIEPLNRFKSRTLYSISNTDHLVPYISSSISNENPYDISFHGNLELNLLKFTGFDDDMNDKINKIIKSKEFNEHNNEENISKEEIDEIKKIDKEFLKENIKENIKEKENEEIKEEENENKEIDNFKEKENEENIKENENIKKKENEEKENEKENKKVKEMEIKKQFQIDKKETCEFDIEMIKNLNEINWRRIDYEFKFPNRFYYLYSHTILLNYFPLKGGIQFPKIEKVRLLMEKNLLLFLYIFKLDHLE
jgi:flagellar biosynthesis GTPase FlhF